MRLCPHNVKVNHQKHFSLISLLVVLSDGFPMLQKAVYRAAKASMSLDLLNEAKSFCEKGIENDPSNEDMKKLLKLVNSKKQEKEQHEAQVSRAVVEAKV